MTHKPSFIVVSLVLCLLALLGGLAKGLEGRIPPPKPNRLGQEDAPYLLQASSQRIHWYAYGDQPFAEARRLDRPILFAVGAPWSEYGRRLDVALSDREVVNYLNHNFLCVRVDVLERPDWVNNLLPVSRVQIGFGSGVQCWILDSEGRMFDLVTRTATGERLDPRSLMQAFIGALDKFRKLKLGQTVDPMPGQLQKSEMDNLERLPAQTPDAAQYVAKLRDQVHPIYGGFPMPSGLQIPRPQAIRFLLGVGENNAVAKALDPMLASSYADLLDGGFFRQAKRPDWHGIEFDKSAIPNADLCVALAQASRLLSKPLYAYHAKRTLECLLDFARPEGIAACRVGDENRSGRSARSSIDRQRLSSGVKSPADQDWVFRDLGLAQGSQRLLSSPTPDVLGERLDAVLMGLREAAPSPTYTGFGYAHVDGYLVARLFEASVLLDSKDGLAKAVELYTGLQKYRAEDDVIHHPGSLSDAKYLEDYLACADASLQCFLATGSEVAFSEGLATLRRARFLFGGNAPGEFFLAKEEPDALGPSSRLSPEIVDNIGPSCTARMIRLCRDYGRLLLGGKENESGLAFLKSADAVSQQFGTLCAELGPYAGAYFAESSELQASLYAVVSGPGSIGAVAELRRLAPTRLVSPAMGLVRKDIQAKGAGVFVASGDKILGPLSAVEAAKLLAPALPRTLK